MKIFKAFKLTSLIFVCFIFNQCKSPTFYETCYDNKKELETLPILYPYTLQSHGNVFWRIEYLNINDCEIKTIGLKDSVIVAYFEELGTCNIDKGICPKWVIINAKEKTEKVFLKEDEYLRELIRCKITNIKLKEPTILYNNFERDKLSSGEWHLDSIK